MRHKADNTSKDTQMLSKAAEFKPKAMCLLEVFILMLLAKRETWRCIHSNVSLEKNASSSHRDTAVYAEMSPTSTLLRH